MSRNSQPRVFIILAIVVITIVAVGLIADYELTAVRIVQFRSVYWGRSTSFGGNAGATLALNSDATPTRIYEFVANDSNEWTGFWQRSFGPCCPIAQIDFTSTTVIAVLDGGSRDGFMLNVTGIDAIGSRLLVHVLISEPSCQTAEIVIWPIHIVAIPKTALPMTFSEETAHLNC